MRRISILVLTLAFFCACVSSAALAKNPNINTVAGGGHFNPIATQALLADPGWSLAVDSQGNVYFPCDVMERVFKLTPQGQLKVIAGNGAEGYGGDNGPATAAELNLPVGVAVDAQGNVYIADRGNNRVRRVDAATGIISTVAGNGTRGFSGDGGAATSAELSGPWAVAVDNSHNIFIADARTFESAGWMREPASSPP
jgi:streptogramin lyase